VKEYKTLEEERPLRPLGSLLLLVLLLGLAGCLAEKESVEGPPDPEIAAREAYQLAHEGYSRRAAFYNPTRADRLFSIEQFEEILEKYPNSSWADDSLFEIAHAYDSLGEYERSVAGYRRLAERYPESELAPLALYLVGRIYEKKLGAPEEARAIYRELLRRYPGTYPAGMAEGRLEGGLSSDGGSPPLFFDDFNDENADGWVVDQGTWSVVNGTYEQSDTRTGGIPPLGGRMFSHIDGSDYSDFEVTVELQVVSSPTRSRELALVFRDAADLQDFYHLRLWSGTTPGDDHFQLWKYVNGTPIFLTEIDTGYWTTATVFVFKVSAIGNRIKAKHWEKGTPEPAGWDLTIADSSHSNGSFALATWNTHGRFDNVWIGGHR
jgi:tetratricopeptide (TPR) repeat protein